METEQLKEGYYAVIPLYILQDSRLTSTSKLIYGQISALVSKEGYCWASNSYFSNLLKVSVWSVSMSIKKLETEGHIKTEVNKEKGNLRKIWIIPIVKTQRAIKENLKSYLDKPKDHNNNKIKNKNFIIKNNKGANSTGYGNKSINLLIAIFKKKTGLQALGESEGTTRRYAWALVRKYDMATLDKVIDWLLTSDFWKENLTKVSQLFYQLPKYFRKKETIKPEEKTRNNFVPPPVITPEERAKGRIIMEKIRRELVPKLRMPYGENQEPSRQRKTT